MTEDMPLRNDSLLRRLRRMRVLVIHPDNSEREMFLAHLRRIVCQVDSVWPAPSSLPDKVDVVLFLVSRTHDNCTLSWMSTADEIARIGIISFETPEILAEPERLHVHGVLSKPIRLLSALAAPSTAVGLARQETRLKKRVFSLDETLRARRKIEERSIFSPKPGRSQKLRPTSDFAADRWTPRRALPRLQRPLSRRATYRSNALQCYLEIAFAGVWWFLEASADLRPLRRQQPSSGSSKISAI